MSLVSSTVDGKFSVSFRQVVPSDFVASGSRSYSRSLEKQSMEQKTLKLWIFKYAIMVCRKMTQSFTGHTIVVVVATIGNPCVTHAFCCMNQMRQVGNGSKWNDASNAALMTSTSVGSQNRLSHDIEFFGHSYVAFLLVTVRASGSAGRTDAAMVVGNRQIEDYDSRIHLNID